LEESGSAMKRFPTGHKYGAANIEVLHPDLCCIVHPKIRCIWCRNVVCAECLDRCWPMNTVGACCVFSTKKGNDELRTTLEGYGVCSWEWLYE
jgi:hypothetical protein